LQRHQRAAVGKADALAAIGDKESATEFLLSFIQSNPDTFLLDPMFSRIIDWLPVEILSAEHPTLVRLAEWSAPTPPPGVGFINVESVSAAAAWPEMTQPSQDLKIFSLYARAVALHRVGTPASMKQAEFLLLRLRIAEPMHFLTPRSLLTLGRWKLDAGDADRAFAIFDTLRQNAKSPLIRGEAAFLDAGIAFENGDSSLAIELFNEAAKLLTGENNQTATLNSALVQLAADPSGTVLIQNADPQTEAKLNVDLSLEKALLSDSPMEVKTALDTFLTTNPDHPRAAEARLAIIEASLKIIPPDLSLAQAQLDTLREKENPLPTDKLPRLALAEIRLYDLSGESEKAVELAKETIALFPDSPAASEASLAMGKSLFEAGNYNEARLILEKLATAEPGTQRSQAALLLAARSAALGATVQSREEALGLFDKAIKIDGPLRSLAVLEKARLNIDLNRLPIAIASLREAYAATPPDDPSRLPTGLLLAEAIYASGDSDPKSLQEALDVYEQLLGLTASNPSQYFRLQYLRGLTLEKLPDKADPTKTRIGDALSAYFSVLDRPIDPAPPEWEWFERSGFRALTILENANRWQAAISIAEKIASFKGPRSEEASTRARQIRLKHMIYEDTLPNQ
jgi:tetratricopeptide (TPR) repeat protein